MTNYIWDAWLPKLSSKDRLLTDVDLGASKSTPFSDILGFPCLSERTSFSTQAYDAKDVELSTANPTPLSSRMGWSLLGGMGEGHVDLKAVDPYPLSSRMGWKLLSDRKYFGVAETAQ
ncbi:hypothetical protein [Rhodovulum euryhalinum]|uniref:Uncharacterized protein n=1 Tax=Rhodovulum euryhalinum TaxID=35805 RepID=A0A4R2KUB8_9RHOB|nr:hypothetical protein [Rhodovulum euryhalinum]TCO70315.1 hypothetical protein EV655_11080 [Rhodovulum euryhalinum]